MQQASIILFREALKYWRCHLKTNGVAEQTDLLLNPLQSVPVLLLSMYGVPSISNVL